MRPGTAKHLMNSSKVKLKKQIKSAGKPQSKRARSLAKMKNRKIANYQPA